VRIFTAAVAVSLLLSLFGCAPGGRSEVVAYVSVDRSIAEPMLAEFERQSSIRVLAVYDTEANKTTGLVNRLIAEEAHPSADVFWSGEIAQTLQLDQRQLLAGIATLPADATRDARFRGANGTWRGFAARARVLLAGAGVFANDSEVPSVEDLALPAWKGRIGIADPHFGTTRSHLAALLEMWGEPRFRAWLVGMRNNGVHILPGNAQVRDAVVAGTIAAGLTDSDDAVQAEASGAPVRRFIPRQSADFGPVFIPNSIALVRGGPHGLAGERLVEYLLSKEVEDRLVAEAGVFYPTRADVGDAQLRAQVRDGQPASYSTLGEAQRVMLELVVREWFGQGTTPP
jgi:iron(III) transport system substrate-binding protein